MDAVPAVLPDPIVPGIAEYRFPSSYDGSTQSFLEVDFRKGAEIAKPLVVIYLHGAASHQDQGMTAKIYDGAFDKWAKVLAENLAVYICPEYRGGSWMGPAAESDVRQIISDVREKYPASRLILAGGSMGGTSSLIFASRFGDLLDGVIALCPATDPALMYGAFAGQFDISYGGAPDKVPEVFAERRSRDRADALARLPIAIVHGDADVVIPVEHSRVLVERLREKGGRCLYIEMAGGDHDAPLQIPFRELLEFVASAPTQPLIRY